MVHVVGNLNWLAIAVSIICSFLLGGIWFPFVVNNAYVYALEREMKTGVISLVGPLACLAVMTITSAILIRLISIDSYSDAVRFGLLVGIGYQTPMVINIAINPLFPRPFIYSAINAPYFIGSSVLSCVILNAWR